MRVVVGNDTVISTRFFESDDETVASPTGDVTVSIATEDGSALTGGIASANADDPQLFEFTLTAAEHAAVLRVLTVTWTATVSGRVVNEVQTYEVVGSRYFRLFELRALKGLQNKTQFPNEELRAARDGVEAFIDDFTEKAWSPRSAREVHDGNNITTLYVNRSGARRLISVSVDGVPQTITNWVITEDGQIRTDGDTFPASLTQGREIVVKYEWGHVECPADLKQAALKLARHVLLSSDSSIPDRARMMQTQFGMFIMDVASEDKPTGLPEVDSVLVRRRYEQPFHIA